MGAGSQAFSPFAVLFLPTEGLYSEVLRQLETGATPFLRLLRLQLWEQDHVADAFLAEEHHAQAVNRDTPRDDGG